MRVVRVFHISDTFEEYVLPRPVDAPVREERQIDCLLFQAGAGNAVWIYIRDNGGGVFAKHRTYMFDLLLGRKDGDPQPVCFDFSLTLDGSVHHIGFVIDYGCAFDRLAAFQVGDKHFRMVCLAPGKGCQAADAETVGNCQLFAGNRDLIFVQP